MQVDSSFQSQILRTDLRWVAKRKRKSQRAVNFAQVQRLAMSLCRLALGSQTVKNLRRLDVQIWARPKSTQVGGQTKRKWVERKSTCEACVDLRVWLASALEDNSQIDFLEDNIQVK